MSYIGNQPTNVAFLTDSFSGNGSTTAFTMQVAPANTSSVLVAISGVLQDPSTYSVLGTTLTFSAAPPTGTNNISVRYMGIPASGVTTTAYRTVTNFTATAGQTSFSVPSYTVGYIDVYLNGVRLAAADYTATNGTTVVLANAAAAGASVVTESFYVSSVLNAIPATAGAVNSTYITDSAVTTAKLDTAAVTQAKVATGVAGTGPAFSVFLSASQNGISNGVATKVTLNSEQFDTNNNFDSSTNYRFTPTVAGYYMISGAVYCNAATANPTDCNAYLYKNGSSYAQSRMASSASYTTGSPSFSVVIYMNGSTDYLELYGILSGATGGQFIAAGTYMTGALVRAA